MLKYEKVEEWRPGPCGTRLGDIVNDSGILKLMVKCRRCTKQEGHDMFHFIALDPSVASV